MQADEGSGFFRIEKYTEVKVEAKRKIVADIIRLRRHSIGTSADNKT